MKHFLLISRYRIFLQKLITTHTWSILFICTLLNDDVRADNFVSNVIAEQIDELGRMWKEVLTAYFTVLSRICLEELRKTAKNLCQDSLSPDTDLNPGPYEYEARVLITRL